MNGVQDNYSLQEPCDYAISHEAVMKIVDEEWLCNADYDFRSLVESLEKLPPVNPQEPKTDVLDKIRAELHATAEMHEDGDYYLREEWIDEIIDKHKEKARNRYDKGRSKLLSQIKRF